MSYKPSPETQHILDRAMAYINSVPYDVPARWVFYRLLQDGTYPAKQGYKHLLGITSKARKSFYGDWRPWTLVDNTRSPLSLERDGLYGIHTRGWGFKDPKEWIKALKEQINCPLDMWLTQIVYEEIWFEAAAMQGQFRHYANPHILLLAFKGDCSIPAKWESARRIAEKWLEQRKPIHILYYGDYDLKGLTIPDSAWGDISQWALLVVYSRDKGLEKEFAEQIHFHRVGINEEHIDRYAIPENPERPGTYQWEALTDEQAQELIAEADERLLPSNFDETQRRANEAADGIKKLFKGL